MLGMFVRSPETALAITRRSFVSGISGVAENLCSACSRVAGA